MRSVCGLDYLLKEKGCEKRVQKGKGHPEYRQNAAEAVAGDLGRRDWFWQCTADTDLINADLEFISTIFSTHP